VFHEQKNKAGKCLRHGFFKLLMSVGRE